MGDSFFSLSNTFEHILGGLGEQWACQYLQKKGYRIEARNVRGKYGEIDIIARSEEFLVCVEVKTRNDGPFPSDQLVPKTKQRKIIRTLNEFALRYDISSFVVRFDVIVVHIKNGNPVAGEHYQHAFEAS